MLRLQLQVESRGWAEAGSLHWGSLMKLKEEPRRLEPLAERILTPGWKAVERQGCAGQALLPMCTHRKQGPVSAEEDEHHPEAAGGNARLEQGGESLRKKEEPKWEAEKHIQG